MESRRESSTATTVSNFAENLARIEDQIAAACRRAARPRAEVALMAVSKTHPASAILEAVAAGVALFGENRVQEFQQKSEELAATPAPPKIEAHLIGKLQSNKSAKAAEIFSGIDSLDSLKLALRLNEAAARLGKTLPVLLELKLSPEESKTGLEPDSVELAQLLERLPDLPNLKPSGLMTVPPYSEDPETARPYFRRLRELRDRLARQHPRLDFAQLSIGMSGDFAVAIEEGSTWIRIGTALFGKRPYPSKPED
jgi:pyridoxal phosphate enzyme (YggS family)